MAYRIGIVADKGGVGRTDLLRLLAEMFAKMGLNVLCVDMDYQAILSRRMGMDMYGKDIDVPATSTLMQRDVRKGQAAELMVTPRWDTEWAHRIKLIPADKALWDIEEQSSTGNPTGRLDRALDGADDDMHITLFDTRPDMGKASQAVWAAADVLLGVTPPLRDGAEGLLRLLVEALSYAADLDNPDLAVAGVVINEYNPEANHQEDNLKRLTKGLTSPVFGDRAIPILEPQLPRRTYIEYSADKGLPLETYLAGTTIKLRKQQQEVEAVIVKLARTILEVVRDIVPS